MWWADCVDPPRIRQFRTIAEIDAHRVGPKHVMVDGVVRELSLSEVMVVRNARLRAERERFRADGCCGCRNAAGRCGSQSVVDELREVRARDGMGKKTLGLIGDLCPQSELWMAYEITKDADAVGAAKNQGAGE